MSSRTVLVSGAGSGIGRAIAKQYAYQGDQLVLLGRTQSSLEETQKQLQTGEHQILVADVSNRAALTQAINACPDIDIAIANAGIGGENNFQNEDRWDEVIATNLSGNYYFASLALEKMKKNDSYHHLIFISSILARLGVPGYSAYCASKAGVLGLMRSLASAHSSEKVLVNALCPGWVDTEMAREGIRGFAEAINVSYDEAYKQQMSLVPLGKMSTPEEIASFVCWLSSPEQTSITGQSLDINNGALMPT